MIRRAGVIYQDANSRGFLEGLKQRLRCEAVLIPAEGVGSVEQQGMTARQARRAWAYLQGKQVDVVVRLTDADGDRWQEVRRNEETVFQDAAAQSFVCGVAVNNTEEWLALDPDYVAAKLDLDADEVRKSKDLTSLIKGAIARGREPGGRKSELVARLVADAPGEVFKRWLQDDSFRAFYSECRQIASRYDCETPNEL